MVYDAGEPTQLESLLWHQASRHRPGRRCQPGNLELEEVALRTKLVTMRRPLSKVGTPTKPIPEARTYPPDLAACIEVGKKALTVVELAALLSVSTKQLYKMIRRGDIPSFRIAGSIRMDPVPTARWLRSLAA